MSFSNLFMLLVALPLAIQVVTGYTCDKTPLHFQEKYAYYCVNRQQPMYRCKAAWSVFGGAFAYKDPATVTQSDYENYFKIFPIISNANESLFWSGTFELAGLLSCMCPTGADLVSSSNTPSSAIINDIGDINWCGSEDGIDYDTPCLCDVSGHFWDQFSVEFASVAKEVIFYLANGERDGGAFRNTSAFAQYEIPNLEYPRVTQTVVLNVHRKGKGEACGMGTLNELKSILESKRISYTCYDIYGNVMDESQTTALSICASLIVNATQKGVDPVENKCYSKENTIQDDDGRVPATPHSINEFLLQLKKIGQRLLNIFNDH